MRARRATRSGREATASVNVRSSALFSPISDVTPNFHPVAIRVPSLLSRSCAGEARGCVAYATGDPVSSEDCAWAVEQAAAFTAAIQLLLIGL
jgi:hypothetical protein